MKAVFVGLIVLVLLAACSQAPTQKRYAVTPTLGPKTNSITGGISVPLQKEVNAPKQKIGTTAPCTDNDGGMNPKEKGVTQGKNEEGSSVMYEDTCIREDLLMELYCAGSIVENKKIVCLDGACKGGKCVDNLA